MAKFKILFSNSLGTVGKVGQYFISNRYSKWFQNNKTVLVPVGELDLEMLSVLHTKHPGVTVDNEVVEPNSQQLLNYRGTFLHTASEYSHTNTTF